MALAVLVIVAVLLTMAGEAVLSRYNERLLRSRGAVEPPGDVYKTMQWAYPLGFVAMGIEGAVRGMPSPTLIAIGLVTFGLAKTLKIWAIASLGTRWSYRVLVLPGAPLVSRGPYRFLRHPNYLAVLGEIAGVATVLGAFVTGVVALIGFGSLMAARVKVEDAALRRQ